MGDLCCDDYNKPVKMMRVNRAWVLVLAVCAFALLHTNRAGQRGPTQRSTPSYTAHTQHAIFSRASSAIIEVNSLSHKQVTSFVHNSINGTTRPKNTATQANGGMGGTVPVTAGSHPQDSASASDGTVIKRSKIEGQDAISITGAITNADTRVDAGAVTDVLHGGVDAAQDVEAPNQYMQAKQGTPIEPSFATSRVSSTAWLPTEANTDTVSPEFLLPTKKHTRHKNTSVPVTSSTLELKTNKTLHSAVGNSVGIVVSNLFQCDDQNGRAARTEDHAAVNGVTGTRTCALVFRRKPLSRISIESVKLLRVREAATSLTKHRKSHADEIKQASKVEHSARDVLVKALSKSYVKLDPAHSHVCVFLTLCRFLRVSTLHSLCAGKALYSRCGAQPHEVHACVTIALRVCRRYVARPVVAYVDERSTNESGHAVLKWYTGKQLFESARRVIFALQTSGVPRGATGGGLVVVHGPQKGVYNPRMRVCIECKRYMRTAHARC